MIILVPIEKDMDISSFTEEPIKSILEMTLTFYKTVGFEKPWISYLIKCQDEYVGSCAFKGLPVDNRVEIAYHTFPAYEGRGISSNACKTLIDIVQNENKNVTITARTLPEKNASTTILTKNNFNLVGKVIDPDDGEVFEWVFVDGRN